MKVELTSTTKIVELQIGVDGPAVPARVWEGVTAAGVPVFAFITRVAAERTQDLTEFERDLQEHAPPSPEADHWPSRMIL